MKRTITQYSLLLCMAFLFHINANAQSTSSIPHTFLVTPGAPAIPVFPASGNANYFALATPVDEWDTLSAPTNSFTFTFGGVAYTKLVVSSNGWVALCPSTTLTIPPVFAGNAMPTNLLSNNTTGFPIIAPLWDDLAASVVTYNWGTPNVVWIRWTGRWDKNNIGVGGVATLFYLKLDGGNNTINFYYANASGYIPTNPSASIGIAGVCTGDFYSVGPTSATAAYVDSVTEINTVGQGGTLTFPYRPFNTQYTFTPITGHPYDACASAKSMGTIPATCGDSAAATYNATSSGLGGNCGSGDVKDVWFSYIKPVGMDAIQFTTKPGATCSVTGTRMEVYSTCGGAALGCASTSVANPGFAELTLTRPFCTAETLLVRVTGNGDIPGKFKICAKNNSPYTGTVCTSAIPTCFPLPYTTSGTTNGALDDYDDSTVCQSAWMTGQDILYTFAPTVSGCFNFTLSGTGAGSFPGLHIFDGCPDDTANTTCVASSQSAANGGSIDNITLTGGHAYYILIDNNATLAGINWINYTLNIANSVTAAPNNDNCGTPFGYLGSINLNTNCAFGPATYNLQCATPSPSVPAVPNPVCGGIVNALTPDVWFSFQATFSGSIQISTQGAGANPAQHLGMAIYTGTCGALTLVTCQGDSTGIVYLPSVSFAVTNQIYYVRVWSATYGDPGSFQLCFQSNCAPPNDYPTNAVALPLATPAFGDNTCSTGANEMANPINCPTGVVNTVWYKITVPASGNVAVRISQVSLTDASLAAFTFPGGPLLAATSFNRLACNDDIIFAPPTPICGMSGDNDAAIQFTATAGTVVYIAVDGEAGAVGSFWITAIDGNLTSTFPPIIRKDCANPELICDNSNYNIPNGGIGSDGNICDFQNLACSGGASTSEVGSTWLQFTVTAGSQLGFTVTPNDSANAIANYNFYLWDVTSAPNICNLLGTTAPIRCNTIVGTGKTGLRNPPSGQFSATVPATTTKTYLLYIQNLTSGNDDEGAPGTATGFTLDWTIYSGGVPVGSTVITGSSSVCNWQGIVVDTNYSQLYNWKGVGNCPAVIPTCNTDVNIYSASKLCYIPANAVVYARTITIHPGGSLTMFPGSVLHVCGDFVNNGNFIAQAGSTVIFEGAGNQQIKGTVTGANAFASLTVTKAAATGTVKLTVNADLTEHFLTSNSTSIFDVNLKYLKIGGNFTNNFGRVTYIGEFLAGATSTQEFNGTLNQNYINTNDTLFLHRVFMNKPTGNLYLKGLAPFGNLYVDTLLNMTSGNIVTGLTNEVFVRYGAAAAMTNYGVNSYVDGKLRRKLWANGSIDYPVGDSLVPNPGASKGYELANITLTASTVITDLTGWFNIWPGPVPLGPSTLDPCAGMPVAIFDQPIFDNGYWSFQRSVANFNGQYNVTLFNTGGTNTAGGIRWTVGYAPIASPVLVTASWGIMPNSVCVPTSTAAITKRNNFNSPANSGTSYNHNYATLQSITELPVELLYFNAEMKGEEVICTWETESETNNDHFVVERSLNGHDYIPIGTVKGFGPGVTSQKRSYSFLDQDRCEEVRYYRLKQIDIDGEFSYSNPIALNCGMSKDEVKVYPNPGKNNIVSTFYQKQDGKVTIQWLDLLGKVAKEETYDVIKGFNTVKTDITSLSNGVYYIRIKDTSTVNRQIKFLKN